MKVYILKCSNKDVTDYYLSIIKEAFQEKYDVVFINKIKELITKPRNSIIITARISDFLLLDLIGFKKQLIWMQGVEPEESYLKHHNKIKFALLSLIEKYTLINSLGCFLVSKEMQTHLENKYRIHISEKSYIMPCFNCEYNDNSFLSSDKYYNNTFCYIGSLSVWQCFEQTILYYKKLENILPHTSLKILTPEIERAKILVKQYNIKNYTIQYVKNDEITEALKDVKYGFILRDNIIVNNVATPTKLSTYISNGVIPIYSTGLKPFNYFIHENKIQNVICVDNKHVINETDFNSQVDLDLIKKEYKFIFQNYYNRDKHVTAIFKWSSTLNL